MAGIHQRGVAERHGLIERLPDRGEVTREAGTHDHRVVAGGPAGQDRAGGSQSPAAGPRIHAGFRAFLGARAGGQNLAVVTPAIDQAQKAFPPNPAYSLCGGSP